MNNKIIAMLLIAVCAFIVYSNSLNNKFVWDDYVTVKENPSIKSWFNLLKILTEDLGLVGGKRHILYRPLQMLTYMIDYSFWKLNEIGYHLTNIALHILMALCIYWLVMLLSKGDAFLAFLTGALFVIHPIHTNAVTYISGRADSLCGIFMILSFILYIKSLSSNRALPYFLCLAAYFLSLLSKEYALILPVLLLLYNIAFRKSFRAKEFFSIVLIACLYIAMRMRVSPFLVSRMSGADSALDRIPAFFAAMTDYARLLFLPFNLHMEYGWGSFLFTDPKVLAGVALFLALIIYALVERKRNALLFFSVSWLLLAMLPFSNLYRLNAYMAEHWLYIPSIGFFIIISIVISSLCRRKERGFFGIALGIGLFVLYSSVTINQNRYWKDPVTIYKRTLKFAPRSAALYNNLACEFKESGNVEEAIRLYKRAIELDPNCEEAYANLGTVYNQISRRDKAAYLFNKSIEVNPEYTNAYLKLALLYGSSGKQGKALGLFKKALELDPKSAGIYNDIGNLYKDMGDRKSAGASYLKALELDPSNAESYNNLGIVSNDIGRVEESIELFNKAIKLDPGLVKAHINLANAYSQLGRNEEAYILYKKVIMMDPANADAYNNLGTLYKALGRDKEALSAYKMAANVDPKYAPALMNLAIFYYEEGQYDLAIEYCDQAARLGLNAGAKFLERLKPYRKR